MTNKKDISNLKRDVEDYVKGNFEKESVVRLMTDDEHSQVSRFLEEQNQKIILTRDNLIDTLKRYEKGEISIEQIAIWGKFIFLGFIPPRVGSGIHPIFIDQEPDDDDLMREVVMRLEWVGDIIDGTFTPDDARRYIKKLE